MRPGAAWRSRLWVAIALVLTLYKFWLTRGQGLVAVGDAAHEDRLYLELARHLIQGNWLGPAQETALAVGPSYPAFIAGMFALGVPLFLAQHLLYATACALFVQALRPALSSGSARCAIYLLLLWNPMTYDAQSLGRVSPNHVAAPLALLLFAGLIALHLRRERPSRSQWGWVALTGFAGGTLYLTQDSVLWLFPAVVLLGGATLAAAAKHSRPALRQSTRLLAAVLVTACLPVLAVCVQNKRHYDRFATRDVRVEHARADSPAPFWSTAVDSIDSVTRFSRFNGKPSPSTGTPDELNLFRDITGERLSPPTGELDVVGAAEYLGNVAKAERLHGIGKVLRQDLIWLVVLAEIAAVVSIVWLALRRTWSFPFTLALAAAGAVLAALLGQAASAPVISGAFTIVPFVPLYPLVLIFVAAVIWGVVALLFRPNSRPTSVPRE